MKNSIGTSAGFLILGLLLGLSINDSFGRGESDAQKWERLAKAREIRRANEFKFEACIASCQDKCK